ncbi:unnamed protein product, partial [Ceratitis capitata]
LYTHFMSINKYILLYIRDDDKMVKVFSRTKENCVAIVPELFASKILELRSHYFTTTCLSAQTIFSPYSESMTCMNLVSAQPFGYTAI